LRKTFFKHKEYYMAGKQWIAVIASVALLVAGTATLAIAQQKPKGQAVKQAEKAKEDPKHVFDGSKAKPEPVKVEKSTTTKESPVGQPVSDYKPKGPSVKPKEVPPPKK
jgi:hypothetical protein